jgi:hypothetical protein
VLAEEVARVTSGARVPAEEGGRGGRPSDFGSLLGRLIRSTGRASLPQDKLELKALSECLADPSRKDLGLLLVGSADRRGSEAYNQELSERRAERVKELLVNAGISTSRIAIASRGERGAVGDDRLYSYGYDRRVDVLVHGVKHAPR